MGILYYLYAHVHQTNLEFGKSKTTKYLFWLLGLTIHDDVDNDARHDVSDVICGNKKMVVLVGLPIFPGLTLIFCLERCMMMNVNLRKTTSTIPAYH